MSKTKSKALVGYKRRDSGTHRRYNFKSSIKRYKKTGKFVYVGNGSGHEAGEKWAEKNNINPDSMTTKYSKNSPSFDEGVYKHKETAKARALLNRRQRSTDNKSDD